MDILAKYDHLLQEFKNKNYAIPMEQDLKLRKSEADLMTDKQTDYVGGTISVSEHRGSAAVSVDKY